MSIFRPCPLSVLTVEIGAASFWVSMMKKTTYAILAVSFFVTSAQAETISLNFVRASDGAGEMASTDVAGVIPVANWNTATAANANAEPTGIALVDDTGAATGATATWQSGSASWSVTTDGAGSAGDKVMMTGYLDQGGDGVDQIHTVNVTDIPFAVYDVYLYHSMQEDRTVRRAIRRTGLTCSPVTSTPRTRWMRSSTISTLPFRIRTTVRVEGITLCGQV